MYRAAEIVNLIIKWTYIYTNDQIDTVARLPILSIKGIWMLSYYIYLLLTSIDTFRIVVVVVFSRTKSANPSQKAPDFNDYLDEIIWRK